MVPRAVTFAFEGENGDPSFTARFEVRDERPECVAIHVESKDRGRGIRTSDLAVFNLDNLAVNVFAEVALPLKEARRVETGRYTTLSWDAPASEEQHREGYRDVHEARHRRRGTNEEEANGLLRSIASTSAQHRPGWWPR